MTLEPRLRRAGPAGGSATGVARDGVVLAAGLGSRLSSGRPKPLTPVGGEPLLLRALRSLEIAGCARAVVVLGHAAEAVHRAVLTSYRGPLEIVFAFNERFALKNGVSVLCARRHARGDFVLTMCDHVLDDAIPRLVSEHRPPPLGATLCVDYGVGRIFDLEDATKVREEGGKIQEIGKALTRYNCVDTGVFVCTPGLMEALAEVFAATGDASVTEGMRRLARDGRATVLDIGDAGWQDVDTKEMLAHAEAMLARRAGG